MSETNASPTSETLAKSDQNLVWIDCEMTGLDPEKERLLEIAESVKGAAKDDSAKYAWRAEPVRQRLRGLETFNELRGGEYLFMPSLSALKWLGELK